MQSQMKRLVLAERTGLKREPELGWVQKQEEGSLAQAPPGPFVSG